jgi:hypothetical protein
LQVFSTKLRVFPYFCCMDAKDFAAVYRARLDALQKNRPKEVLIIASELKAQVQFRIQSKGTDFAGAAFIGYSPAYSKTRKERGRQVGHFDFTFTGQAWNNIRPVVVSNTETSTTVEVGAQDAGNRAKLYGALTQPKADPRGKILQPSRPEIALAGEANQRRIQKYLQA